MTAMLFINKYLFAIISALGFTLLNGFLLLINMSNRKIQKEKTNEINNFTKAVEEVDNMDDNALISLLGGMRSDSKTMHTGNQNAPDK